MGIAFKPLIAVCVTVLVAPIAVADMTVSVNEGAIEFGQLYT